MIIPLHHSLLGIFLFMNVFPLALHTSSEPVQEKPEYIREQEIINKEQEIKKHQDLIRQKEDRIVQLKQLPAWTPTDQETVVLQTQIEQLYNQNKQLEQELETIIQEQTSQQNKQRTQQELKKLEQESQALYEQESELNTDSDEALKELLKTCLTEWLAQHIAPHQMSQQEVLMEEYNQALQDLLDYEYKTFPTQQEWTAQQWQEFENGIIASAEKNPQTQTLDSVYYNLIKKVRFYKQQLENLIHTQVPLRPPIESECYELLKKRAQGKTGI